LQIAGASAQPKFTFAWWMHISGISISSLSQPAIRFEHTRNLLESYVSLACLGNTL
jgi:hypothetical protein